MFRGKKANILKSLLSLVGGRSKSPLDLVLERLDLLEEATTTIERKRVKAEIEAALTEVHVPSNKRTELKRLRDAVAIYHNGSKDNPGTLALARSIALKLRGEL